MNQKHYFSEETKVTNLSKEQNKIHINAEQIEQKRKLIEQINYKRDKTDFL